MNFLPIVNHSIKYNPLLDALRGIAIILVLLFHIYPSIFSFGYVGVDIFFVLSGYLITQVVLDKLNTNSFKFSNFYRNRIRRIYPAMLIVLSASLVLGYLFLYPFELVKLATHIKSSVLFYQNFRLVNEAGYWDISSTLKPLLHFWSLSIEEQFYIFYPVVLILLYKYNKNLSISLFSIFIVLFLLPLVLDINNFYHSIARFWELSFGGFIYTLKNNSNFTNLIGRFKFLIYICFIGAIAFSFNNIEYSVIKTLLIVVFSGLLISISSIKSNIKVLNSKILIFFGLISFPLYLWHYAIISYMHILSIDVVQNGIYIVIISVFLSYLTYRYIEIYARTNQNTKFAIYLVVFSIILGLVSQYVYAYKGLSNRSHLVGKELLAQQFEKIEHSNKIGLLLVNNILGFTPNNSYIRATSDNINKDYAVVIGDSHAHTSYQGFADELKKQGLESILIAGSGCPPYLDYEKEHKECANQINPTHEFLDKFKNTKKIIFITRQNSNDNIKKIFEKYGNKDIPFYFLIENPLLNFSPDKCFDRPFGITKALYDCKIRYEDYIKYSQTYRDFVYKEAKKYNNIHILDPKDFYCDYQYCYAIRDNTVLYSDENHHSLIGSKLQAKFLIDTKSLN